MSASAFHRGTQRVTLTATFNAGADVADVATVQIVLAAALAELDALVAPAEDTERTRPAGGRPPALSIDDVAAALASGAMRQAELLRAVMRNAGCSRSTAKRRLKEAVARGCVNRAGRGAYVLPAVELPAAGAG